MFTLDGIRELYRHMEWADTSVWRSVLAQPAAEADKKIRGLLVHIHVVQRAFLHVWTKQSLRTAFKEPEDFATLPEIMQWSQPYYREAARFLDTTDAAALTRPVTMPWVEEYQKQMGQTFSTPTLAETMFQVASHSTYHRGQVNLRLRELGGEPPLVDFIAWIWFGKPTPQWT
jgi:uncharacterized damage-inducible protein DinB